MSGRRNTRQQGARRRRKHAAALLSAAILGASCGSTSGTETVASTTAPTTATTEATTTTVATTTSTTEATTTTTTELIPVDDAVAIVRAYQTASLELFLDPTVSSDALAVVAVSDLVAGAEEWAATMREFQVTASGTVDVGVDPVAVETLDNGRVRVTWCRYDTLEFASDDPDIEFTDRTTAEAGPIEYLYVVDLVDGSPLVTAALQSPGATPCEL